MKTASVKRVLFGLVVLCVSSWGLQAQADEIHSAIYVLTDTSGSMLETPGGTYTYGDGSLEHPHAIPANVSRLYMAKEALTTVVYAYGEVRWGLARFAQNTGDNYFCMCHNDAGNDTNFPCSAGTPGLDQERDASGTPVCMQCDMSAPYPDYDLEGVNDRVCINYAGGIYAGCTDPHTAAVLDGADILVALAEDNEDRILMWIDHQETAFTTGTDAATGDHCFSGGVMQDCELRGVGGTPIGGSLADLRTQLSTVDIGNDPLRGCRPYSIIVLTDGANSCAMDPIVEAGNLRATPDLLNTCAVPADCPQGASCDTVNYAPGRCVYDVKTYVIGFALTPIEFQQANDIANAGGTGTAIPATDQNEIASAMAEIIAESIKPELCDGIDNDCDGDIDEDFPIGQVCNNGLPGVCYGEGTYVCDPGDPTAVMCQILPAPPVPGTLPEICDGLDNDCDGEIDEGGVCTCNGPELCNGFDDYCGTNNPWIDGSEDPNVGQVCGSDVGACSSGVTICSGGSIVCNGVGPVPEICDANVVTNDQNCNGVNNDGVAPQACQKTVVGVGTCDGLQTCDVDGNWTCWAPLPAVETCNNHDDDCDGAVDEGLSRACQVTVPGVGTCNGTETCNLGAWVGCTAATPTAETCNNLDDNCDGSIDEGLSQPCSITVPGIGTCNGTETCQAGAWIGCTAQTPTAEICNNQDDDCDGSTDENVTQACYSGPGGTQGVGPCIGGTQTCTAGSWGACSGQVTPTTESCNGIDDDCDGSADEGLGQTTCGQGVCQHTIDNCVGGVPQTCDPFQGAGAETCNSLDDDCDGVADGLTETCYPFGTGCSFGGGTWSCVGTCNTGTRTCPVGSGAWGACQFATGPVAEVCDNQDNNCNGSVDEGLTEACYPLGYGPSTGCTAPGTCLGSCTEGSRTCTAGAWGACGGAVTPTAETCNNADDDCDGVVDDNLSRACQNTVPGVGTCTGVETCTAGAWGGCTAQTPTAEICNNIDDDCDGVRDENLSQPCSVTVPGIGTCNGTETCQAGAWVGCTAQTPTADICNNPDDDCDGAVDENLTQSCYNGPAGTQGVGICVAGARTCTAGAWGTCTGEVTPLTETCNGADDDCDGSTDEGLGQTTCGLGVCQHTVNNCVGGVPQTCDPNQGATAETCNGLDDNCDGVADGLTETCYAFGSGCTFAGGVWTCVGTCNTGSRTCPVGSGTWGSCQGSTGPVAELCDGLDNNCNGAVDEGLTEACYPLGYGPSTGCTAPGTCLGVCTEGNRTCGGGAWGACGGAVTPSAEVCDGLDNDCDGQIDEGVTRACQVTVVGVGTCSGIETCTAGAWGSCTAQTPTTETCNNIDDDCDGAVDENLTQSCQITVAGVGTCTGSETCQAGAWVGCTAQTPTAEICNNHDDDCDGAIDENLTQSCYNGPGGTEGVGLCQAGSRTCTTGAWSGCVGEVTPVTEVCNGQDDDCDGATDEGLGQTTCGLGVCQHTVNNCIGGVPQTCDPNQGAGTETCNGLDDDCNGVVDGLVETCYPFGAGCTFAGGVWACAGTCNTGSRSCPVGSGSWGACQGATGPVQEVCDGLDNNCDGQIDEGVTQACYPLGYGPTTGCTGPGSCQGLCHEGIRNCSAGSWGVCGGAVVPAVEVCDGADNDCDGAVDENLSQPCQITVAGVGTCTGVETCSAGSWGGCTAATPAAETCNNLDDDCDGAIDEGVTQTCYTGPAGTEGVGACHSGTQTCTTGTWGACVGQVTPTAEVCDGIDNDCDGQTDEDTNGNPLTGPCYSGPVGTEGVGVCHGGTRTCTGGSWGTCAGEVAPTAEQCNGLDDDCDTQIDENLGSSTCGLGECQHTVPNCVGGVPQACDPFQGAQAETCDGLDNDCDGMIDGIARTCYEFAVGCTETSPGVWSCDGSCAPGLQVCPAGGTGAWGECLYDIGPSAEVCDGLDNDCDGDTDEDGQGNPLSQNCYPPGSGPNTGCTVAGGVWSCLGLCQAGTRECAAGVWGTCNNHITPAVEVCDGSDNDCDGQIDEDSDIPGLNQPCGTALGRCTPGILRCINSVETCEGGDGPFEGVCNGQDDDCDGEIDEPDEVADEEGLPCGLSEGACEPGTTQCVGGAIQCVGGVNPTEEVCDGEDNDCDGLVDNGAVCPVGSWCVEGDCRIECDPTNEFPCPGTLACEERPYEQQTVNVCMEDGGGDCGGTTCPDGWICQDDVCVDPCDNANCQAWEECTLGTCIDVSCTGYGQSCDSGQFCLDHECVDNPCLAASCDPESEHCIADCPSATDCSYTCQPLCLCGLDEICGPGGVCEPDLCGAVECAAGQICDPTSGQCITDPCFLSSCSGGEVCHDGDCYPDPCLNTSCPIGFSCEVTWAGDDSNPVCVPDEGVWTPGEQSDKFLATGGGGCSCDQSSATNGGGNLLVIFACLGLLLGWRRRRALLPALRGLGVLLVSLTLVGATGCKIDPWQLNSNGNLNIPDAGPDTGIPDAEPDACVASEEVCDGVDNDCDDLIDEDFDLQTDRYNCGSCGTICEFDYGDATCIGGDCHLASCFPGHWDNNGDETDGCEYSCHTTNNGVEVCDNVDNDCDGEVDEDFDLQTDPLNCGQCHRTCSFFNGVGSCTGGQCELSDCRGGHVDKDGDPDNGCECTMNLAEGTVPCVEGTPGACAAGEVCADVTGDGSSFCAVIPEDGCDGVDDDCDGTVDEDAPAQLGGTNCYTHPVGCTADASGLYTCVGLCQAGVPTCSGGAVICGAQTGPAAELCDNLDNDCNGVVDDGYDKQNDPANCGGCGIQCSSLVAHAIPGCTGGQCVIIACLPGFWDINGDPSDGCEYSCSFTNGGMEACGDGVDNDCDGQIDEGFDYTTDPSNCGSCGNSCSTNVPFGTAVTGCTGGVCQYTCEPNHYDLNGDVGQGQAGNGCEYACSVTNGGVEACDNTDNDCDGQTDEGFDKQSDVNHCGGCNQVCADHVGASSVVAGCANGVCQYACVPGTVDLNGDVSLGDGGNGCECQITNGGTEICDNIDNDCDGSVDEDVGGLPLTQACYGGPAGTENVGPCKGGTQTCAAGTWGSCQGQALPLPEVCDNIDNDCDGVTDEDAGGSPLARPCYSGPAGTQNVGPCVGGNQTCSAGTWGVCAGEITPQIETCDGVDNDCDSAVDEDFNLTIDMANCGSCGYACPAHVGANSQTTGCVSGACQFLCQNNFYDLNGDLALGNTGNGCEYACTLSNGGVERCGDGVDNDCDGQIDEGFNFTTDPVNCGSCGYSCAAHTPFGATSTGCSGGVCQYSCQANFYDLNGDLALGGAGNGCEYGCTVSNGGIEACDNQDNDCDGVVDEGFNKQTDVNNCGSCGVVCTAQAGANSVVTGCANGVCQFACAAGFVDLNGNVSLGSNGDGCEYGCTPSNGGVEACDNIDNDCDGVTDEAPGGGPMIQACYSGPAGTQGVGPCVGGNQTCTGGAWGVCQGQVTPQAEVCDNVDNDCDGATDEAGGGGPLTQACYTGPAGTLGVGLCVGGTQSCAAGAWGACAGQVIPQLETCDGQDNDCDNQTDEDFNTAVDINNCGSCGYSCAAHTGANSQTTGCAGGACLFVCQSNFYDLNGDIALGNGGNGCEYGCTLTNGGVEACGDGVDNDCDGQIDEGFNFNTDPANCGSCGNSCAAHTPFGATSTGCSGGACQYSCQANFYDLNGDLALGDAGNGCEYGCTVSNGGIEACDNQDNDCDGTVDEGFNKQTDLNNCGSCGYVCSAHRGAASTATGCANGVCQFACVAGAVDLNGDVSLGSAGNGCEYGCTITNGGIEICDGQDNDCDGATDEDAVGAPLNQACYTGPGGTQGVGPCVGGNQTCTGGAWGVCQGEVTPQAEVCDNVDNDCDGSTDEAGGGGPLTQACYTGPAGTQGVGLCVGGSQSCTAGAWGVCAGEVTPQIEVCDSQDNDCDSQTDEGFNTTTDITNCGACGYSCVAHVGAFSYTTGCVGSLCQYSCQANHHDLNGDVGSGDTGDGCEYACTVTNGGVEACGDGVDNDCDGSIDEGFNLNTDPANCGACGYSCAAHTPAGAASTGCVGGACQFACQAGRYDINGDLALGDAGNGCEYACSITNGGIEICDDLDNDCDGIVDDGFDKQTDLSNCGACGYVCSAHTGAFSNASGCASGNCQFTCQAGHYDLNGDVNQGSAGNGCEYACIITGGGIETCDNVDNDCDGATDEDAGGAPLTQACYTGPGGTQNVGVCHGGTETCTAGAWGTCAGEVTPVGELCDGLDNDCDNQIDEDFDTTSDLINCGACGASCWTSVPANAYPDACNLGVCHYTCLTGFNDLNGDLNSGGGNGCEYTCPQNPPGAEYCDGVDNDCDGSIDEGLTPPVGFCYQGQVGSPCFGVGALCEDPDGPGGLPHSWYCQYPAAVERDPANPNQLLGYETLCDGLDGDCDGLADDNFNIGAACDDGNQGVCRGTGNLVCRADQTNSECNITSPGGAPTDEVCDAADNDCDGLTDETEWENNPANDPPAVQGWVVDDVVTVNVGGVTTYVYQYEASRPSAGIGSAGVGSDARACSRPTVIPWANVTYEQAANACARAGMRLCAANEWYEGCDGSAVGYPYGAGYNGAACNGHDQDPAVDAVEPTGTQANCTSPSNAEDMSGNLREWTTNVMGYTSAGKAIYAVRGGSFTDYSGGLACDFTSTGFVEDVFAPNVGFRCCTTCGNGTIEGDETCEGGPGCNPITCGPATCGDGNLDAGEQCDDGNLLPLDGCGPTCRFEPENCSSLYPGDEDNDGNANCADSDCALTWCDDTQDNDGDGFTEANGDCCDSGLEPACGGLPPDQVHPAAPEICGDGIDNNCNGFIDNAEPDGDGDGALPCVGGVPYDCDDQDADRAPTHIENTTDGIDNDCDTLIDEAPTPCGACAGEAGYPAALDICDWWFVSGNMEPSSDPWGHGCRSTLANSTGIVPHQGSEFLVLSSGNVDASGGNCTGSNCLQENGFNIGNGLQSDPEEGPANLFTVYDQVQYHLVLQVPTNVYSFSFDFAFFSAEYPEYVCTGFNDEFYAIIQSLHPDYAAFTCNGIVPAHPGGAPGGSNCRNVSFDGNNNKISINAAFIENPQDPANWSYYLGPNLPGTGYQLYDDNANNCWGGLAGCTPPAYNCPDRVGGSTAWLTTTANVLPGETIRLIFDIHDESDDYWDSRVIIDNFRWGFSAVSGPVTTK
ncbi:MAG: MopE-related protein [bacterium]